MKKTFKIIITSVLFISVSLCFAEKKREINISELEKSTGAQTIEFENYTGPHTKIDSLASIKGIGKYMGDQIAVNVEAPCEFSSIGQKYYVIHAVDPDQPNKLDADIFMLSETAAVDHIKNLRWILASYLTSAYGYEEKDAYTISTFITVYNAVYRGKLNAYSEKYKDVVLKYLNEKQCGISTKWTEWAGNSQLVIPLNDLNGGLSTVETSVISDKQVVNSMKEEDDKGIDERKNMVDIKEREAEIATEKAQDAQKEAAEGRKEAQEQQEIADKAQKASDEDPDDEEKRRKAEEERLKAEQLKKEAEESAREASKQQLIADKKTSEAQNERKEISKDQEKVIEKQLEESMAEEIIIGLKINDFSALTCTMVKVNAVNGKILRESPVTLIRGRTIFALNTEEEAEQTDYIAICGENTGNGAIKLCILDGSKMEIQRESSETIAPDSVLVKDASDYYCVITDNGKFSLGKFNGSLKLLLKSKINISSASPVTVTAKGIIVNDEKGNVILLSKEDLSPVN